MVYQDRSNSLTLSSGWYRTIRPFHPPLYLNPQRHSSFLHPRAVGSAEAMPDTKPRGSTAETGIDRAIQARLDALDSGNYRANNELILRGFSDWLARERDVTDLEALSVLDCRRYAQHLRRRAQDPDDTLSGESAVGPYFTVVRAFLSWCVDDERLDANPARPNRVKEALPESHGDHDRQFWGREERDALLSHANERVHRLFDTGNNARVWAYRDRATVSMLALSGARGAELFADPRDDHRDGLRWRDVDLDRGIATVFGKTRERQPIALVDEVVDYLDRYHRVLDPASDDWPVFPTAHTPTLASTLTDTLAGRGWGDDDIAAARENSTDLETMRRMGVAPPSLSKNGARSLLKRLCDEANIEIDGEYLKPHGGRRGIGHELYETSAELAQDQLRHESIETTHESYREQNVVERRSQLEDALSDE